MPISGFLSSQHRHECQKWVSWQTLWCFHISTVIYLNKCWRYSEKQTEFEGKSCFFNSSKFVTKVSMWIFMKLFFPKNTQKPFNLFPAWNEMKHLIELNWKIYFQIQNGTVSVIIYYNIHREIFKVNLIWVQPSRLFQCVDCRLMANTHTCTHMHTRTQAQVTNVLFKCVLADNVPDFACFWGLKHLMNMRFSFKKLLSASHLHLLCLEPQMTLKWELSCAQCSSFEVSEEKQ